MSKQTITNIKNTRPQIISLGKLNLYPGDNSIDEKTFNKNKIEFDRNPAFRTLQSNGILVVTFSSPEEQVKAMKSEIKEFKLTDVNLDELNRDQVIDTIDKYELDPIDDLGFKSETVYNRAAKSTLVKKIKEYIKKSETNEPSSDGPSFSS